MPEEWVPHPGTLPAGEKRRGKRDRRGVILTLSHTVPGQDVWAKQRCLTKTISHRRETFLELERWNTGCTHDGVHNNPNHENPESDTVRETKSGVNVTESRSTQTAKASKLTTPAPHRASATSAHKRKPTCCRLIRMRYDHLGVKATATQGRAWHLSQNCEARCPCGCRWTASHFAN